MKAWRRAVLSVIVLLAVCANSAWAQDDEERSGMGVFLDWIHKLSGPAFVGGGASYFYGKPGEGWRFRLTVSLKVSFRERDTANVALPSAHLDMLTIQPTVEYGLADADVDFGVGGALDLYLGGFPTRTKASFPLYVQYRSRNDDQVLPRIGTGIRLIQGFRPDDFPGLGMMQINRDRWEIVWQGFGGVDVIVR